MPGKSYGPTPRRSIEIEARRHRVAHLYLEGQSQYAIARLVGMTQQQISMDLKIVRKAWLDASTQAYDARVAQELAKIDHIEYEAWAAWERSKQPREVTMTEQTEGGANTRKASVRREGQAGDPRFLERIHKCIDQRCALLGLITERREDSTTLNVVIETRTREAADRLVRLRHDSNRDALAS